MSDKLFLSTLNGTKSEDTPLWMMRQAGRTLPEYRAVRAEAGGFKDLLMSPDRAAEVTLQPIDAYGVDAAILFSDILVVPEAMGLPYNLVEKVGPRFPETIRKSSDLARLHEVDPERDLKYVLDAVRIILRELDGRVPLIGFAGAPWTLFCYMVEGKGSKDWTLARRMLWEEPALSDALLSAITAATSAESDGRSQTVAGFRAYFRWVSEDHDGFRLLFGGAARHDAAFGDRVRQITSEVATAIIPLIAVDIPEEHRRTVAHGIVGLAEGVSRRLIGHGHDFDPDEIATVVAGLAWAGLRSIDQSSTVPATSR